MVIMEQSAQEGATLAYHQTGAVAAAARIGYTYRHTSEGWRSAIRSLSDGLYRGHTLHSGGQDS